MKITTKYNFGDRVFVLSTVPFQRKIKCTTCDCTGKVTIKSEEYTCPVCHGECLKLQSAGYKAIIAHEGTIGKIAFEQTDPKHLYSGQQERHITYMIDATGIGSGTLWSEKDVFPSRSKAQAECDRRNSTLTTEDDTLPLTE